MFYDARLGVSDYASLFNPLTHKPFPTYESFRAFNELYKRGAEVELTVDADGVYAAAAKGEDGAVMAANTNEDPLQLSFTTDRAPVSYRIIDGDGARDVASSEVPTALPANSILVIFTK